LLPAFYWILLDPEDGGSAFLRNVGEPLLLYTESHVPEDSALHSHCPEYLKSNGSAVRVKERPASVTESWRRVVGSPTLPTSGVDRLYCPLVAVTRLQDSVRQ
jgi:hypothetical protein